jgi:sensor histidine kinase YesM
MKSLGKIYRRLKSIYKNNFSMEIDSKIEDGTTITIQIPKKINIMDTKKYN